MRTPFLRFLLVCLLATAPGAPALAYFDFTPTPLEFAAWPEYCAVQYVSIMEGRDADFSGLYSQATIQSWRDRIGDNTFLGLHHYCSSIHYLNRAKAERDKGKKRFLLDTAVDEVSFSLRGADQHSIVYPDMVIMLALIKQEQGHPDAAIAGLEKVIEIQPTNTKPYSALAMVYKRQHKLAKAKEVLDRANEATHGESSDVQYNLGLINLELGDVDAAVANAQEAYKQGYPLPWLRDKLKSMGRWEQ